MKYRNKPVVVEAFQMTLERRVDNSEWPDWLNRAWQLDSGAPGSLYSSNWDDYNAQLMIGTMEGTHLVSWGDYIIQGVAGEIYPCKPDIFEKTYEPVTDEDGEMTDNKSLREQVAEAIESAQDDVMDRIERGDIPDGNWTAIVADAAIKAVMEVVRCGRCKHWDNSPWQTDPETRLCLYRERRTEANKWADTGDTGPEFGCIRWEAKDGQ